MNERRISIIIVPPGGASTVQRSISVFRAKLLLGMSIVAILSMVGTTGVGLSLWKAAARGRQLRVENDSLRVAASRMSDLERRLADLERTGGKIRSLLEVHETRAVTEMPPAASLEGE